MQGISFSKQSRPNYFKFLVVEGISSFDPPPRLFDQYKAPLTILRHLHLHFSNPPKQTDTYVFNEYVEFRGDDTNLNVFSHRDQTNIKMHCNDKRDLFCWSVSGKDENIRGLLDHMGNAYSAALCREGPLR